MLSRRDVLAAFLGAPIALAAGCSAPRLPPAGEIVGASHGIGHRIRDGYRPRPSALAQKRVDVLIVGGGAAGLAAAWRLNRLGLTDVAVLELEQEAGGTARSGQSSVSAYPWGAHYLPMPLKENFQLIELLDEMDVLSGRDVDGEPIGAEQFLCRDPEERIFSGGSWHEGLFPPEISSPEDLAQQKRFRTEIDRWAAWRDGQGRRAFAIPVEHSSDDSEPAALDRITMAAWLDERQFTSHRLRWLVDYACRDDYGMTSAQASAWAGLFYFVSRMRRPGDDSQPLLTWPEGNGRLIAHLASAVKSRIHVGQPVTDIVPAAEGSSVDVISVRADGSGATRWTARRVIFAAPQFLAPHLITGYDEERKAAAAQFQYGSWMVANLTLTGRPSGNGFPLCWDNVLEKSPSLGYIVATHQRGIDFGPTVLTYYYPLCDDDSKAARARLLSLGWEHWCDICLTDLEQAHPEIRRLVERLDVMRWGHAMIRPQPGFIHSRERRLAAEPFGAIHFAHCDLSGIALFEEAFHHGVRAAEEVAAALRT